MPATGLLETATARRYGLRFRVFALVRDVYAARTAISRGRKRTLAIRLLDTATAAQ